MRKALKPSFQMADDPALVLGNTVVTALTGNTHIPTPQPSAASLQTALDAYTLSLAKAKKGSSEDKAQKNADKEALITLLREEADYVNMLAKGDEVILASCGLPLSKERQPNVLGTPEAKVEQGASGKLILSTPAVAGAKAYKHQYKADADTAWSEISTTKANCTIEGLTPGTMYSLKIVAIGTRDQMTESEVVTKMAA